MASATLDFPQPLGPTIAAIPRWKFSEVLSAKDLNPKTVRFLRYMTLDTEPEGGGGVKVKPAAHWGKLFTGHKGLRVIGRDSVFEFMDKGPANLAWASGRWVGAVGTAGSDG